LFRLFFIIDHGGIIGLPSVPCQRFGRVNPAILRFEGPFSLNLQEFGRISPSGPDRAIRLNKVFGALPQKLYTASIPCAEDFFRTGKPVNVKIPVSISVLLPAILPGPPVSSRMRTVRPQYPRPEQDKTSAPGAESSGPQIFANPAKGKPAFAFRRIRPQSRLHGQLRSQFRRRIRTEKLFPAAETFRQAFLPQRRAP
jgi:hypothetical protein